MALEDEMGEFFYSIDLARKMDWIIGFWVLVGIIVWRLNWYCNNKKKKKKKKKKDQRTEASRSKVPKGNFGWPFIGETIGYISSAYTSQPVSFMEKRKLLHGEVFKTHILGTPIIVSTDPDVNKAILQNHGAIFVPAYPKSIRELLGEHSILQTNGSFHKKVHSLIGGFLRSPQLKQKITRDIENSVKLSLSSWQDMQLIHVQEETKKIAFEILVKVLLSIGPGEDLKFLEREFEEFIKGLICLPVKIRGTRLYKSLKAKERLLSLVRKTVEERVASMERSEERGAPKDAVDILLHDGGEGNEKRWLPLDFISGNIIEMMIPGEQAVPIAMTVAVYFLSNCPLALNRLTEENMELKKKMKDSREDYSWTDYMSLPFTQHVINETLRMANIINGVWRKTLKEVDIKGHLIPEGWCVLASFLAVHMNEENYEDPCTFNPWRWEKLGGAALNNSCFTPFGGGQRLCPGLELSRLEISVFLHHLITTYRWTAEEDKIINFPTVKMKRKLPIKVYPLKNLP